MFNNLREDIDTYDGDWSRQGLWVMTVYRFGRWRYTIKNRYLRLPFSGIYKVLKLLSQIVTGFDLPCEVVIGRRFRIEHFGDIIISGDTQFGDDVAIGANAVVLTDIPPNSIAVGVPARIIPRKDSPNFRTAAEPDGKH